MTIAPPIASTDLHKWEGRTEQREHANTAAPLAGLIALLDWAGDVAPAAGSALPTPAHWLCFVSPALQSDVDVDVDGHPLRGGFLPAVPLPPRVWAGGRIAFDNALRNGETATCRSTISNVEAKEGRSGALVFVTVTHEITHAQGMAVREEQDLVYRNPPPRTTGATTSQQACTDEGFCRLITPDPALLFRYSAFTCNAEATKT